LEPTGSSCLPLSAFTAHLHALVYVTVPVIVAAAVSWFVWLVAEFRAGMGA
jgi:hypothetical protein